MDLASIKKFYQKAKYAELIDALSQSLGNLDFHESIYLALTYAEIDQPNKSSEIIDELIAKHSDDLRLLIIAESAKSRLILDSGKLKEAENYSNQVIEKLELLNIEKDSDKELLEWVGYLYNTAGSIRFRQSLFVKSIDFHMKSLAIRKKLNNPFHIAASYGNLAIVYNEMRKFRDALEYYQQSLHHFSEGNYTYETRITYNNMGVLFLDQGRLQEAEEMIYKSIEISKEYGDERLLSTAQNNLGSILRSKNELEKAMKYYLDSLEIRKKRNNPIELRYSYYYLFLTSIDKYDLVQAEHYLNELENLDKEFPDSLNLKMTITFCKGLLFKNSIRTRQKAKAYNIFESIIQNNDFNDSEMKILARLNICEMLLSDLKSQDKQEISIDEEMEIVNEVEHHVKIMNQMVDNEGLANLSIEVNIIQAYIHLSKLEIDKANAAIMRAKSVSEELGILNVLIQFPEINSESEETVMSKPIEKIYSAGNLEFQKSINIIIHSLPRLQIILYLAEQPYATFSELKEALGFSPGNLGKHCDKLVEVGYIAKNKNFIENRYLTQYELTSLGLSEFKKYTETFKLRLNAISI